MLFALFHRLMADQDGAGRTEPMLAAQIVFTAIALA